MVTLYTTNCPKCKVLKFMLERSNIAYVEESCMDDVIEMGFMSVPVLKTEDNWFDFASAVKWVNEQKGGLA